MVALAFSSCVRDEHQEEKATCTESDLLEVKIHLCIRHFLTEANGTFVDYVNFDRLYLKDFSYKINNWIVSFMGHYGIRQREDTSSRLFSEGKYHGYGETILL